MISRKHVSWMVVVAAAALSMVVGAAERDLSALEVVENARDVWRGETFHAVVSIEVTRDGYTESQRVEVWAEGEDKALVRILEPEDEAGSGYLLLGEDLWYYAREIDEVIPLPGSMLFDSFLGSGLDLDELMRGTVIEHYEVRYAEDQPEEGYRVVLIPFAEAPVVYGRLELTVSADFVIMEIDYHDQRGTVVKTARVPELVELAGRVVPRVWIVEEETGDRTMVTYEELAIDEELPDDVFTLERLKQP